MDALLVERPSEGIAVIRLNRPEVRNAFSREVLGAFREALFNLEGDSRIRVLIITGTGEKAFSAGADLAGLGAMTPAEAEAFQRGGQELMSRVAGSPLVSIAAVNGHALGGGLELALACDLRVVAEGARLGLPEARVGLIPAWGGIQRIARAAGPGLARELLLTGRLLEAPEALAFGVVDRVVPAEAVWETALQLASLAMECSPSAQRGIKWALQMGEGVPLERALAFETEASRNNFVTSDRVEGIRAFLEKRPPAFFGR